MLLRIKPSTYVSLEHVQEIILEGESSATVVFQNGSRTSVSAPYLEPFVFFLQEVFIGNVIDVAQVYEKKDEIMSAKALMKDKIEEMRKQREADPEGRANAPTEDTSKVLRGPDGKPFKNVIVMPPRGRQRPGGGSFNGGNAA